jgi:subtilisin-like proprotein convertase family protein
MNVGTYLGVAHDFGVETCDATVFGNEPGIGWNYCWSENTTQGYSYAPGQGSLIYRSANQHDGIADSSNVAAGTHFYHPDDSFTNLIGCPLNGDWYIEVQDGWSLDNGYVFGWELALSTEALPDAVFEYEQATGEGPWLSNINGSLFSLDPPADLAHDTVIAYTFSVADSNGCSFDTTVNITFGTYCLQSAAIACIASNAFSHLGRVTARYAAFVPAFREMETVSSRPASRRAVFSPWMRSESPFVLSRRGGHPGSVFAYFAVSQRRSSTSVGSP